MAALTAAPKQPHTPVRDEKLSTKTSVVFSWPQTEDNDGEGNGAKVSGYKVYMAQDYGNYVLVYDGSNLRTLSQYI